MGLWYPDSLDETKRKRFTPVFSEVIESLWSRQPIHANASLSGAFAPLLGILKNL